VTEISVTHQITAGIPDEYDEDVTDDSANGIGNTDEMLRDQELRSAAFQVSVRIMPGP